ncbi:MAG: precorrin-6y C5,15-methyltransferase (decarboxylating) subunit CbiE [Methylobacteriaceae bacterium]|nr:precorrin-6y C5,15-methyltransferase (decarboxylating) subunit CbiE [Methylobacteriaceae bacterium]
MTPAVPIRRWLSIVGLGEDGLDGLSPAARGLLTQAGLVVGGRRHLALVGEVTGERLAWPSPPASAFPQILTRRGTPVCVLASGDPFFYGIGSSLVSHLDHDEFLCIPGASAFSLAAGRLGWALQDCTLVSLHGRVLERIVPYLQHGARILALSWDGATPGKLAALLRDRGLGNSRLTICQAMGGARERLQITTAESFGLTDIDPLNTTAVEVVAAPGSRVLPLTPGLPDDWFEHDGQITKREVRAITLAALAPRQGEVLWDIGAGSGSIGIEWMLRNAANRAIAVEARKDRAARIARNAAALGVPDLEIIEGEAPAALAGLRPPDAVFVGGGATDEGVLDASWARLRKGGRLVVNAVTLETQAEITRRFNATGGDLSCVQVAHAAPVGGFHAWRPALPVVQWVAVKP